MTKYEYLKRMREIAEAIANRMKDSGNELFVFYKDAADGFMDKINKMPLNFCEEKASNEDLAILQKYENKLKMMKAGIDD